MTAETGIVKSWIHGTFGFIGTGRNESDIFFHRTGIKDHWHPDSAGPRNFALPGEEVRFKMHESPEGLRAEDVEVISLRYQITGKIVAEKRAAFDVVFVWSGSRFTAEIRRNDVINGLYARSTNLSNGDFIVATAYTDHNGAIKVGRGVAWIHPTQSERQRLFDTYGHDEILSHRRVIVGPVPHPRDIVDNTPTALEEDGRYTAHALMFHRHEGNWYATVPDPKLQ